MQRNLQQLANHAYDLVVVGGGIYGACVARDAALRGLSVALVEKGDFGHATSFNSLKVIHGGLRYLQHLDIRRMRQSIHERKVLMRIAPHLVHPLPFIMPTYGHALRGAGVMRLALAMNDAIGFDRNRGQASDKYLPRGQVISRAACQRLLPGIRAANLTGGAIWYDCQMSSSERLTLSFLKSAVEAGADVANYTEVTGFLQKLNVVQGVTVRDRFTRDSFDIRARMVVNACGPWTRHLLAGLRGQSQRPNLLWSKAMNLVVDRLPLPDYAVGVSGRQVYRDQKAVLHKGTRLFFIVPWHRFSLIGTMHAPLGNSGTAITEEEIADFLTEINDAYPAARLRRRDVRFVYGGLLPMHEPRGNTTDVSLTKQFQILDHQRDDRIDGMLSVVGVKYTEARHVAERVVDRVCTRLGRPARPCRTAVTPVFGGGMQHVERFLQQEIARQPHGLGEAVVRHLVRHYGTEYSRVLTYLDKAPELWVRLAPAAPVLKAEVLHAIHEEMAMTLSDVVCRRTGLGLEGNLSSRELEVCARIMATELGWDSQRIAREVEATRAALPKPTSRSNEHADRTSVATQDVS